MRIPFIKCLILIPICSFSQLLNNTTERDQSNILYHSLLQIYHEYKDELGNKIVIIEGKQTGSITSDFGDIEVINSKYNNIYLTVERKLHKDYKRLIGKELVRLIVKDIYVKESKVYVPILLTTKTYSSRSRRKGGLWKEGQWIIVYKYNNGFYELEKVIKGITL